LEQVLDAIAAQYKDHVFERVASPIADSQYLPANKESIDCNVYG
jgi:hypothetical protein